MSRIRRWLRAAIVVFGLTLVLLSLLRPELGKVTRAIKRLGIDLPDMATAPGDIATAPDGVATAPGGVARPPEGSGRQMTSQDRSGRQPESNREGPPEGGSRGLDHGSTVPARSLPDSFEATVTVVRDGDTVDVVDSDGETIRVRLHGIDAPEHGQRFNRESAAYVKGVVGGRKVRIRRVDVDQFERLIGEIWLGDQRVNGEIVRAGFAWHYRQYAGDDSELALAEAEARRERRGLWADDRPLPPWVWRRQNGR
jgi:endonuclease YncB( thermonuclease family)